MRALIAVPVVAVTLAQFVEPGPRSVIVGGPNGPVETIVTNPIAIGASSTLAIRTPVTCTVGRTPRLEVPHALTSLPPRYPDGGSLTGMDRRTQITITNVDTNHAMSCQVGLVDGGIIPDCVSPGWGDTLYPNGGSITYVVNEVEEVWCQSCSTGGNVSTTEVSEAMCAP